MQSRVRIAVIIAVSVLVPAIAIWQRWSEIRVFAKELTASLQSESSAGNRFRGQSGEVKRLSGAAAASPAAALVAKGDWQGAIDKVLTEKTEPATVASALLDLLPRLPAAGRAEAIQHIANLLPDENYDPVGRMLVNPETPSDIQDLLLMDLLNRRHTLKLPLLLEVARTPEHARARQAKELLQPYLIEDHGTDWPKYQEKISMWLKDHPDS